jgi:hypothetical protein
MVRGFYVMMLAGLVAVMGCEQKAADPTPKKVSSEDVRRDAGQAAETAAAYSWQTKEEFQKKLESRLKELDAEIAKLREKGHDRKDEAKARWDQKMKELEAKRDAARAKLAEVRDASAEAWKDLQKGAHSAWDELDKAFRDAAREF